MITWSSRVVKVCGLHECSCKFLNMKRCRMLKNVKPRHLCLWTKWGRITPLVGRRLPHVSVPSRFVSSSWRKIRKTGKEFCSVFSFFFYLLYLNTTSLLHSLLLPNITLSHPQTLLGQITLKQQAICSGTESLWCRNGLLLLTLGGTSMNNWKQVLNISGRAASLLEDVSDTFPSFLFFSSPFDSAWPQFQVPVRYEYLSHVSMV